MKEKVFLFNSDAGSALRSAVAQMRTGPGRNYNVVIVKSTIDHDASGIMETLQHMDVSLTLYNKKIQ